MKLLSILIPSRVKSCLDSLEYVVPVASPSFPVFNNGAICVKFRNDAVLPFIHWLARMPSRDMKDGDHPLFIAIFPFHSGLWTISRVEHRKDSFRGQSETATAD